MTTTERAAIEAARKMLAVLETISGPPMRLAIARDELRAALDSMEAQGPQWGWTEQGYKVRKAIKEWSSQTGQPTEPTPSPTGGEP
jgi:hypothetical protein